MRLIELEDDSKKLKEASENTVYTCANMDATTSELNGLKEEVENLKRRNIKLEAYTRRKDIKIFRIKESAAETSEKTKELVRIMLKENIKIPGDCVDDIHFKRKYMKNFIRF